MKEKTKIITKQIRKLNLIEENILKKINKVSSDQKSVVILRYLPGFISFDKKSRPLIFSKIIYDKIKNHGKLIPENLAINVNDWDIVITNVRPFVNNVLQKPNLNKINLIKIIPNSNNYLLIGADRQNGYFVLTHYEVEGNELKSLLGRGNPLTSDGTSLGPKDFP